MVATTLPDALTEALERLRAAGPVEVHEDGTWLAALEGFRYEISRQAEVVLLHLWSAERTLVRRVLRILTALDPGAAPRQQTQRGTERLALEVARLGRGRPGRLEFVLLERARPPARVAREQFCARFRDLLAAQFPDETVTTLTTSPDLEHSLSGNYTRGTLEGGSRGWAVIGAAPGESAATYDGILTFGLIWLDRLRHLAKRFAVTGLRIFLPAGTARLTTNRLRAFSPQAGTEIYEYSPENWRLCGIDPRDTGNVDSWLLARREVESSLAEAKPAIERICRLAPGSITAENAARTGEVVLRFRGLAFARWDAHQIFYGFGDPRTPLREGSEAEIERLIRELEKHRSPWTSVTRHPLYRAQPERWLESLVAAEPTRVEARLDTRFLYKQVPAVTAGDRGVMDLLGITREGRLAVLELKASEDIQLVLQAVDYWLRVRWHQSQDDFLRYGYFPGIALDPRPPLLFLVGPALQFHPSGDIVQRYLRPEIELCRVGLSENWRRGLRVVLRQSRTAK